MLRELRNAFLLGVAIAWLRPRAKRLAACVVAVLFVLYAESEFVTYLQSLPDDDPFRGAVKWTLLLKNLVILVALAVLIVPEIRGRLRPLSASDSANTNGSRTTDDAFSAERSKPTLRSATRQTLDRKSKRPPGIRSENDPDPSAASVAESRPLDVAAGQPDRPIDESASEDVGDGFDAVRRKRRLKGRIEQMLDRKR